MYTYCLFCESGKSDYVAYAARCSFGCRTLSAKQIQHTWSKGKMVNRVRELFPGYLFLYSDTPMEMSYCLRLDGVIRGLHTPGGKYELRGSDEAFAQLLRETKGVIGKTRVIRTGGRLEISPDAFKGVDVRILKVDHRASRMQVEFVFIHEHIRTWLEYEIDSEQETEQETEETAPD